MTPAVERVLIWLRGFLRGDDEEGFRQLAGRRRPSPGALPLPLSSALRVLGVARLISSASTSWATPAQEVKMETPIVPIADRHAEDVGRQQSAVNWIR